MVFVYVYVYVYVWLWVTFLLSFSSQRNNWEFWRFHSFSSRDFDLPQWVFEDMGALLTTSKFGTRTWPQWKDVIDPNNKKTAHERG